MRRSLAAVLATLAVCATPAGAAVGGFFPGQPVDGPSADIQQLGDVDLARDGSGALVYLKLDGGVSHVFVSRLNRGAWQAPERIDGTLAGASSQPVVTATDNGRLAIAFINDGALCTVVKPSTSQPYTAPAGVASPASNPSIDMSINGVAYVTFTAPGSSAADVRAARLERKATTFTVLPQALDVNPAHDAGDATKRSKVAVSADGSAVAVFGETGDDGRTHVIGRRLFELRVSTAPQDLTLDQLEGHAGGSADAPDVAIEDDSSFAWAAFRQAFEDGAGGTKTRVIARRLVGSQFEAPVAIDGQGFPIADSVGQPRIAMSGRGDGYAGVALASSGATYGAVIKDDVFNPGVLLGGGGAAVPSPAPAIAENADGLIAFEAPDATIHARPYEAVISSRVPTQPGPDALLSDPALGPVDGALGFDASSDRAGDAMVAFIQTSGGARRLVAARFDRAPGSFSAFTTTRWRKFARPPLKWGSSFELWGPLTYRVEIDGRPVAQTSATNVTVPSVVPVGVHRWRVVAVDRVGQSTASKTRILRVDWKPPTLRVKLSRLGSVLRVTVRTTDATGKRAKSSGLAGKPRIDFGDGAKVTGLRASHSYRRAGAVTLRVTSADRAGNVAVYRKRLHIR